MKYFKRLIVAFIILPIEFLFAIPVMYWDVLVKGVFDDTPFDSL